MQTAETARSAARSTTDLTTYDLYLRALAVFFPITKERIVEALGLLDRAISIDRHYGPVLSRASISHMHLFAQAWAEEPETSRRKARDLARQALQAGENDPGILANVVQVRAYFSEDIGAMTGLVERALALNPSFARGWTVSGLLRLSAGEPDLAIEHIETSMIDCGCQLQGRSSATRVPRRSFLRTSHEAVPLGAKGSFNLLLQPEHLANRFKDAILPPVFATPVMIMVMVNAARNAIRADLDPDERPSTCAISLRRRLDAWLRRRLR